MTRASIIIYSLSTLLASSALAQQSPVVGQAVLVQQQTITRPSNMASPATIAPALPPSLPAPAAPVLPVVSAPATVAPPPASPAVATAFTQSPAYRECTQLANSNPIAAEQKAAEWLKVDDGIGPHHCRAMALYGQRRFAEAAEALSFVRSKIDPSNATLRTYVTRQISKAWVEAQRPDAAIDALSSQITDLANHKGDNATHSRLTAELLLDRARLRTTYGQATMAVQDLDHAVSLNPSHEDVLLERAQAFTQLNDVALAKQDVALVLRLNPSNSRAQEMQRQLNQPAGQTQQTLQPLQ